MSVNKDHPSIRNEELNLMSGLAARGQSLGVDGLPGVGKTNLLASFFQKQSGPESETISFYLDTQKMDSRSPMEFLSDLHREVAQESGQDYPNFANEERLFDELKNLIAQITLRSGKRAVFIFDSCDKNNLLSTEILVNYLQKVKQNHNGRLSFFFAGSTLPTELLKFIGGLNLTLKPLNFYQHQELLKVLLFNTPFAITKFQSEELFSLCGGHPGLTATVLAIAQKQIKTIRWEEFKEEIGTQPEVKNYYQKIWSEIRKDQQETLRTFVKNNGIKKPEILNELEDLEKKGYFRKQNGHFHLFSKLFESFILKNDKLGEVPGLLVEARSERVFKNGMEITAALTSTEFFLLTYFYRCAGKVVKRESLLKELARKKGAVNFSDEALDQLIVRLRSKIEKDRNNPQHLLTLRGRGFQFIP